MQYIFDEVHIIVLILGTSWTSWSIQVSFYECLWSYQHNVCSWGYPASWFHSVVSNHDFMSQNELVFLVRRMKGCFIQNWVFRLRDLEVGGYRMIYGFFFFNFFKNSQFLGFWHFFHCFPLINWASIIYKESIKYVLAAQFYSWLKFYFPRIKNNKGPFEMKFQSKIKLNYHKCKI